MMNFLDQILHFIGISVDINESSSPIVLLAYSILGLNTIGLLCFVNIILYISVIYITEHKLFIDKISKYTVLFKLLNIYRKTRFGFLLFEVILFLFSIGFVIWLCLRLLHGLV